MYLETKAKLENATYKTAWYLHIFMPPHTYPHRHFIFVDIVVIFCKCNLNNKCLLTTYWGRTVWPDVVRKELQLLVY